MAVPGTSEHQLGLAVDIVDINNQHLDETQESTAVQKWLMEHSWEYGFILRYPNDKSEITGIIYEPWHYRYVGREYAEELVLIQANGKIYARHAITTHFVQAGESYIDLVERYVKPVYQPGDILSSSEKVIALCQGRVVTEDQVRPGFWAKHFLPAPRRGGPGIGRLLRRRHPRI